MSIKHKFSIVISLMLISGLALSGVPGLKGVQNAEAQTQTKKKDKDKDDKDKGGSGGSGGGSSRGGDSSSSGSGSSDGGFSGGRGMDSDRLLNFQSIMNGVQNEIGRSEAMSIRTNTFNNVQQANQLPAVARSGIGNPATVAGFMPGTTAYNNYLNNARQAAINSGTSHTSHTSHADSRSKKR